MMSNTWEEGGGAIGKKYVWKYYGYRDSELTDPKTGEEREELGIVVYRTGHEEDPIAYYDLGLSYQNDGITPDHEKRKDRFIEQMQEAAKKGQELQFLKRENLLVIDAAQESELAKEDRSHSEKCPPGYEYVHSHHVRGVYVKPFCRKKRR